MLFGLDYPTLSKTHGPLGHSLSVRIGSLWAETQGLSPQIDIGNCMVSHGDKIEPIILWYPNLLNVWDRLSNLSPNRYKSNLARSVSSLAWQVIELATFTNCWNLSQLWLRLKNEWMNDHLITYKWIIHFYNTESELSSHQVLFSTT